MGLRCFTDIRSASVASSLQFSIRGWISGESFPIFFLRATYAHFLLYSSSLEYCFLFTGPTPIHVLRPRPISYSVGIGTSDFSADLIDASTQAGSPPLELSSFLQDLTFNAVSSPVPGASASVLSPNFQRFLESGSVARSPPPPRVTVCQGTSTRDAVQHGDVAVNTVCDCADASVDVRVSSADKAVQVAVETSDAFSLHDPPVEPPPAASPLVADVFGMMQPVVDQPDLPSVISTETLLEVPEDFSVERSLAASSESGDAGPASESGPEETSPMGPSLIDSDDEPIASRLPGYLNSFKTREVSDQRFLSFIFSFHFLFSLAI